MIQQPVEALIAADERLAAGPTIKDLAGLARVVQARRETRHRRGLPHAARECIGNEQWIVCRITGGVPLLGTVAASGSKNAALPIMAASILADGPVTLRRRSRSWSTSTRWRLLLGHLGVEVKRDATARLRIETVDPAPTKADYDLVRRMRASFCVLGPLLARRGRGVVSLPGGCNIGTRPGRSAPGRSGGAGRRRADRARLRHRRGRGGCAVRRSICGARRVRP